jgi:hypothetical protein
MAAHDPRADPRDTEHLMATMTRYDFNPAVLNRIVNDPAGGVVRDLERRGDNVKAEAKRLVAPRSRTGNLERSIDTTLVFGTDGPEVRIGSNLEYALYLEEGTRPHPITPQGRGYPLRSAPDNPDPLLPPEQRRDPFYVDHPGNPEYPFLRPALEAARI